jgi:hypothetical protein
MPDLTPYEPLTRENTAVLLVDHQIGLLTGVRAVRTVRRLDQRS